jgi:hypothetical protein
MRAYTIHERPDPAADRVDRAEQLVFVRDGFSWIAALFGPFWLLAHRLWWPLLGYVGINAALQLLPVVATVDRRWLGLAGFAVNLLVGLEADTLRRWGLARRGWRMAGTVSGRTAAECERRFFDLWLPSQPILARAEAPSEPSGWRRMGSLLGARP